MAGIEPFSWDKNIAKVTAGWSDGPHFKNPNLAPAMVIVDGTGPGVDAKLHVAPVTEAKVDDVWNQRRSNGK
jgi:hypothetical protein